MKLLLTLPAIFLCYMLCAGHYLAFNPELNVQVTFRVDMSQQTVSPNGIHIAGNFQGWIPGSTPMTLTGDNIYVYTHTFNAGESIEYKFVNGNNWDGAEQIPSACQQNGNRYLTIPAQNTELEAVCFGSCNPCGNPVQVIFVVDMSEQTVSSNGVHVAGSFQGWNPAGTPMTNTGNMVYTATVTLSEGDYHEFKFINGNDWPGEETVPAACGVDNGLGGYNRFLTTPAGGGTLTEVCFGSCYPCGFVPTQVEVTFRVDMSLETVSPDGVHIAGAFQGWDPEASEMIHIGNHLYEATFTLWYGDHHQYKFLNGNTWDDEEIVPADCGEDNGLGGFNRFITVPDMDTILETVCFNSCDPCGTIPSEVQVVFHVDMSKEDVSVAGIHLAGSFQDWDPSATPMNHIGGNIYQVSIMLIEGQYYEYVFINGNTWDGPEEVPEDCGIDNGLGGYNRSLTVPDDGTTLPEFCFSSCDTCDITGISNTTLSDHLMITPNPFNDLVTINYEFATMASVNISIYNIYGQEIISSGNIEVNPGSFKHQMNLNDLTSGFYLVQITLITGNGIELVSKKIVK